MADKVAMFIDGAYLDKILQNEFSYARIDYEKFSSWMSQNIQVLRTYYYNCLPYQSNPPTKDESIRFSKKQSFYNRLSELPQYEIRLGKLEFRGYNSEGSPIFIQKRVDILLGVDLVLLAAKNKISHATILAGDSDFLPAITVAKNEGVFITLVHGNENPPHDDLWKAADLRLALSNEIINSVLR
ncbi:MAG: NYN domain-containing protein [Syntrophomonas sp.]